MQLITDYKTKNKSDKIATKGVELEKIGSIAKVKRGDLYIEVQSITKTDYGIELFVRTWDKDDKQKGFGDGTIEIERIKMVFNESLRLLLVDDENGDIEETIYVDDVPVIKKFRFDPQEALLKRLDSVLANISKDSDKIKVGKKGNTSSVIDFTIADSKTLNRDGESTYTAARDAATSSAVLAVTADVSNNVIHNSKITTFYVRRTDLVFDTSSIGSGQVVSALTLTMWSNSSGNGDTDTDSISFLDNTNQAGLAGPPVVTEDFNDFPTSAIISKDMTDYFNIGANVTTQDFGTYDVIDVTGTSRIGLRFAKDISATEPTGSNVFRMNTGTAGDDPYITVEHAAAASTSIKSVNGLAQASIKSVNGLAIASVKSVNGLSNVS